MKALLVDDDQVTLKLETMILGQCEGIDEVVPYKSAVDAYQWVTDNSVDIAFLDIMMDEADGISLAMEIKNVNPDCKIVFVSGSRDFALDAFQVYASGYLLKPLVKEEVEALLGHM